MHKKSKKKKRKFHMLAVLFLFPVLIFAGMLYSYLDTHQYDMGVTEYTIESDLVQVPIKIALLTDLHNHEYGEGNSELVAVIEQSNPDMIAVVGDMVIKDSDNTEVLTDIMGSLTKIAPTYFCLGNHELELIKRGIDLRAIVENAGAVYLDDEMISVTINGVDMVIGGLSHNPSYGTPSLAFLEKFAEAEVCKLLLCHYPEFEWQFMHYDIDMILCGHLHGGHIRIPGMGPVFAPTQKFFPKYTEGVHNSETATMVVSRGLGSSSFIPRVNNPTELVFVNLE